MHRYKELEKLYNKRLYKKYLLLFFFILILIVVCIGYCKFNKNKKIEKKPVFSSQKIKIKNTQTIIKNIKKTQKREFNKSIQKKNSYTKLRLKIKFILPYINESVSTIPAETNISASKDNNKTNVKQKKETKIKKAVTPSIKNISLKETQISNIKILINNFNQNPSYDLAITISKIYLDKNNLKQAQIWALKANGIAPARTDSWIIFANVLIKEKKLQKAKEILQTYIDSYGQNDIIEEKLRSLNE